jgi:methylmalonic aciduria homocystinuria type C protein
MTSWTEIVDALATACRPHGFDLIAPLQVGWYNAAVGPPARLPDYGRPRSLAVVVGNTRAFWAPFNHALGTEPDLIADPHPVEAYSTSRISAAAEATGVRCRIRWAHRVGPRTLAIQRLAEIAGLAWLAPSNLSVHPVYGPWIALRAAVVFDVEGPPGPPPRIEDPCGACAQACGPAFHRALQGEPPAEAEPWRLWLAVRDACPLGRAYRYDDDQIVYHYAKDRSILSRSARTKGSRRDEEHA